ncbi:MAG: type II toxin-antitoxin system VapC family toxin [Methylobacteriaceae bacterium]|nr:type II toxin-antitoxin system VapC family toxin [Methylobacteriaceae bacterium]
MIAVDTSVVIAVLQREPERDDFLRAMSSEAVIGAPSVLETKMVMAALEPVTVDRFFDRLRRNVGIQVVAFTPDMADVAVEAFRRYGKGQDHPARLNFGDCMAYAVARVLGAPLLFKGDDFSHTDIEPAWRP